MATRTRTLVELDKLHPNPWQPRRDMDPDRIEEMAASIEQITLLQVPMARPHNRAGEYEMAFAHQRVESCKLIAAKGGQVNGWPVGWIEIDVADLTDQQMAIIALTENERRSDVPPLDLARAHRRAIDETGLQVKELAEKLGVARPTLQNNLRVLNLPNLVLERVESGELSMSVAREFLPLICDLSTHAQLMKVVVDDSAQRESWTRQRVMTRIARAAKWEAKWRFVGDVDEISGSSPWSSMPEFDTEAFRKEHHGCLHRVPVLDIHGQPAGSVTVTCALGAWDRCQEQAIAEMKALEADAETGDVTPEGALEATPLAQALVEDPVWQGIVAARTETGPDVPATVDEWEALGSRGEFIHNTHRLDFWKEIRKPSELNRYELVRSQDDRGGPMPPWFPDLEECRTCVIGAVHARMDWPVRLGLICANEKHYLEKLQAGKTAYLQALRVVREEQDALDQNDLEALLEDLRAMSPETPAMLLRAMVASDPVLEWRHPLGTFHEDFSDEGQMVERIRMILGIEAGDYDRYDEEGRTIDPSVVARLCQADIEHLMAALAVHRLRKDWTALPSDLLESSPRNSQMEIPEEAYELVGAS